MKLVGGDDTELLIADLPPPLIADDGDLERVRRLRAALDAPDVSGGDQEQDHNDEKRDDRPRHLDLGATVDLGRLRLGTRRAPAEADERIYGEAGDDDEDHARDGEDEERHIADQECRSGDRREHVWNLDHVLHGHPWQQGASQTLSGWFCWGLSM